MPGARIGGSPLHRENGTAADQPICNTGRLLPPITSVRSFRERGNTSRLGLFPFLFPLEGPHAEPSMGEESNGSPETVVLGAGS